MKRFKEIIIEWLFFINKIAIFVMFSFGVDYISNKYDIPWQIIIILIATIFVGEHIKKDKEHKKENRKLQNKLWNCLNDSKYDCLTIEQKHNIVDTIVEKEFKGVFR